MKSGGSRLVPGATARADDLAALKRAKREIDQQLIGETGELMAALIRQLCGNPPADAITCVPCGHSRRHDCFGKRLAQSVAAALGLPFLQIFSDRFCSGVSHPKEYAKLPPLQSIAEPRKKASPCPSKRARAGIAHRHEG
jgi:hypothetical protein